MQEILFFMMEESGHRVWRIILRDVQQKAPIWADNHTCLEDIKTSVAGWLYHHKRGLIPSKYFI